MAKTTKQVVNDKIINEVIDNDSLTEGEKNFILYYLESYNVSQSYMKAYPNTQKKYAAIKGYQVIHNPKVQSEIKRLKKIMQKGFDIDPSKYIEFLLRGANADIGDYIQFSEEEVPVLAEDGSQLYDPDTGEKITKKINKMHLVDSSRADTSLISSVKQGRDGISINLVDKMRCWDSIREFFEWKNETKKEVKKDNSLLDALNHRVEDTWNEDDASADWEEAMKDGK